MSPDDIKFYHSGSGNCDPLKDLGGPRSSCELLSGEGTLFNDLDAKQSRAGRIDYLNETFPGVEQPDYRCFYVKNTHQQETLRNAILYVDWERKSGSFVDVGIFQTDEIQTVEVMGPKPPNENDSMVLNVATYGNFTVPYHVNLTEWQGRFLTAIRGLDGLQDVQVDVAGQIGFPTDVVFTVYFLGQANSRKLQLITVVTNNLDSQTISVVELQQGSPISVVACTIPNITTAPACVTFDYPLRGSPVELGDLRPNDEFPVWVRRTTPKNTRIRIRDKIRFNVDGTFP